MPWKCPKCGLTLFCAVKRCVSCGIQRPTECWDENDDLTVRARFWRASKELDIPAGILTRIISGTETAVTEREKLFQEIFQGERELIINLSDAELTARRNETAVVAFKARAELTAQDAEIDGRRKKRGERTQSRSDELDTGIPADPTKTKLDERRQRMTKEDKIRKSLEDLGVDKADIDKIVNARNFNSDRPRATTGNSKPKSDGRPVDSKKKPVIPIPTITIPAEPQPKKIWVNPFAKKESTNEDSTKT